MHVATLHIFNVGQGDSVILEMQTGEIMLVDCNQSLGEQRRTVPALDFLEERLRRGQSCNLDILCLTHTDRDHYAGLAEVLQWLRRNKLRVHQLILSQAPDPKELRLGITERLLSLGSASNPKREQLRRKAIFTAGVRELKTLSTELEYVKQEILAHGGRFTRAGGFAHAGLGSAQVAILGPTHLTIDRVRARITSELLDTLEDEDPYEGQVSTNELSCLLWIHVGLTSIMLTGDTTANTWSSALTEYEQYERARYGKDLVCDLVKAPHHGAKSGSAIEIWRRVLKADAGVIFSAGCHGSYRHPHPDTIADIRHAQPRAVLFCTNQCSAYAEQLFPQPMKAKEREAFLTDSPTRVPRDSRMYQGYLKFHISADGSIVVETEGNPEPPCKYHHLALS